MLGGKSLTDFSLNTEPKHPSRTHKKADRHRRKEMHRTVIISGVSAGESKHHIAVCLFIYIIPVAVLVIVIVIPVIIIIIIYTIIVVNTAGYPNKVG